MERPRVEVAMPDDQQAVVRSLFEAFDDGDLTRATALVTDDFELVDMAAGQTFRGPDGCREWLELFKRALPDARTEIVNLTSDESGFRDVRRAP